MWKQRNQLLKGPQWGRAVVLGVESGLKRKLKWEERVEQE
jgi:hypothetical protein